MPPHASSNRLCVNIPLYAIRHQQIGGTEFGIYGMIKGLAQADVRLTVTYGRDADLSPAFLDWLKGQSGLRVERRGGLPGPKNVRFAEETLFAARAPVDDWLLFPNYFCPPVVRPRLRRCVILHDIQYKVFPHFHSAKRRAWLDAYLPWMFRAVDQVVLVSQSEADLVARHFGAAAAAKCAVVPNSIDWTRFDIQSMPPDPATQTRLRHRYILSVCHQFPHKNIRTLLTAFAELARTDDDIRLYLIGSASPGNVAYIQSSVPEPIASRVEILGFVDDFTLGAFYAGATMFALPSLYEGFGLPAVEAMGFGVPTLVSRSYALPEVTFGEAAYVDDPLDASEWRTRMQAMLDAPRLPQTLVDRVRERYTSETVGREMAGILEHHGSLVTG